MMPVSKTFPSKSSSKWQEYVKIIVRKNEENVGWSQTKKVVIVNKLCNFTNLHLCITEHDFILARINDRNRGNIRCYKNDLCLYEAGFILWFSIWFNAQHNENATVKKMHCHYTIICNFVYTSCEWLQVFINEVI